MTLYYETLDMHEKKSRSFFRGNKKMDMKDAWNLRPAHLAPTTYFDGSRRIVRVSRDICDYLRAKHFLF